MEHEHFDAIVRRLESLQSRRLTLGGGYMAIAALAFAGGGAPVGARKKRKKKRKKKKPEPLSCAELCDLDCRSCFFRSDAPPFCGDGQATACKSCASDNDCIGEAEPYCVTHIEERATGIVTNLCDPGVICTCVPGALGACVASIACVP